MLSAITPFSIRGLYALKKLGKTLHISPATGNMIVRAQCEARVGEKIFDNTRKQIGIAFDMFGPVSAPYVSVRPTVKIPEKNIKQKLFLIERTKTEKK